jgi:epoxyqueuosine reductase QueG
MTPDEMAGFIIGFQEKDESNRIAEGIAKKPEYAGRKIYDGALCGIASPDDGYIASLKGNKGANVDMMQPEEWLPGAKSVVSIFTPFARWITEENAGGDWPSSGWLHGRINGQEASNKAISALAERLSAEGWQVVIPTLDPRLKIYMKSPGYPEPEYTVNWAERHVAFAAGLGTFGLSHGLITKLGTAGRLMSFITTLSLEPKPRPYSDLHEYCTKCGACARACPKKAISKEHMKDHGLCDAYLEEVKEKEAPYYGCGKCQCGVPCAFSIPVYSME